MTHDATTGNNYSYDQENRITGAAGYTYTVACPEVQPKERRWQSRGKIERHYGDDLLVHVSGDCRRE